MNRTARWIALPAMLIALHAAGAWCQTTTGTRTFAMGFTPFPYDFSLEAVDGTYQFLAKNGDIIAHHFDNGVPWTEALEDKPFHSEIQKDWDRRKTESKGMKVLVSVTPLDGGRKAMAGYRGAKENMPLPGEFKGKALNDPLVKKAYLIYCRRAIAEFKPDYFAIGIEVNELFHNSPKLWPAFVDLYKSTYAELKKENPNLPIFATITLHNLTNPGWKDREAQQKAIRELIADMDIVGVSYYPFMAGHSERPVGTFDWLRKYTDKPIAITETGYPAETVKLKSFGLTIPADPAKQTAYFETLLDRAGRDRYLFVVVFLHRDYDALWEKIKSFSPDFFIAWKDCGLLDENGKERPAYGVWKRYFDLKRNSTER